MTKHGDTDALRVKIERIVREVLAEMLRRPADSRSNDVGRGLVVSERIASAKEIEKKLAGVSRVVITRGAIITPSAKDLLRERKITIATKLEH